MENFRTESVDCFFLRADRCTPRDAAIQAQDPEAHVQIPGACVCRNSLPVSALDKSLSRRNKVLSLINYKNWLNEQERGNIGLKRKESKP